MTSLQVHARTPLDIVSTNLSDVIALPDPEAAEALNARMGAWVCVEKLHERSFVERGLIIREFERRSLWAHLTDPETGQPFPHLTAWLSCSDYLGCRRTNFEAKRTLAMLEDVPPTKLIDIPKGNLHTLAQLSTAVRNDPEILAAAKALPQEKFLEKVEKEQPNQHIEARKPIRLNPGRSDAKVIDTWVQYAIEHDIAGSPTEAIVRACEMALHDAELDEELASMPAEEATA